MSSASATLGTGGILDLITSGAYSEEGGVDLSGAFVATVAVEGAVDGVNYRALELTPVGGGATVTSVTAAGAWTFQLRGYMKIRARVTAYTSGSPVVALRTVRRAA